MINSLKRATSTTYAKLISLYTKNKLVQETIQSDSLERNLIAIFLTDYFNYKN